MSCGGSGRPSQHKTHTKNTHRAVAIFIDFNENFAVKRTSCI